jgi:inward rectifier potassium channel
LLKKDGSFNIEIRGLPWFRTADTFQHLIKMSWLKFILVVFAAYIATNTFFALLYYLIGTDNLTNSQGDAGWKAFLDAFFFSSQSLTTVGYGRVAPVSVAASTLAAFESMIGLLGFAIATGLLYGRFSRPNARILNSKNILLAPHGDGTALMFRIANKRESQLVDVEVQVTLKRNTVENGNEIRQFIPLVLESHRLNMFPLSWTLVHPIDKDSPLWGKTQDDFVNEDMEVLIYFKAYDETFSNSVHFRLSYKASELIWGAKFILNFEEVPGGPTIHHLNRVSDYEKAELPEPAVLEQVTR